MTDEYLNNEKLKDQEMQVRTVWSDPTDKRSDGFAEQAVKMVELSGKSIIRPGLTGYGPLPVVPESMPT
eukprot:COSAG02_NODE_4415_length_5383_cov_1116.550719_4_plen_69_part_00